MAKYVQLTASFEIVDGEDAPDAARHLTEGLFEAAHTHPGPLRMWITTVIADEPLSRLDLKE